MAKTEELTRAARQSTSKTRRRLADKGIIVVDNTTAQKRISRQYLEPYGVSIDSRTRIQKAVKAVALRKAKDVSKSE